MALPMMTLIDMDSLLNRRPEFFAGEARCTQARRDIRGVVAAVRYRTKMYIRPYERLIHYLSGRSAAFRGYEHV
jgi:hypothetical protein